MTRRLMPTRSAALAIAMAFALAAAALGTPARAAGAQTPAAAPFFHPLPDTTPTPRYEGYALPGECLAAAKRARALARQDDAARAQAWRDKLIERDTVLDTERAVARACASHLAPATVPPRELTNLARLYWLAGDAARAREAVARRLTFDTVDSAQAATYREVLNRFLFTSPVEIGFVSASVLPALDTLRSLTARVAQFQAHAALAKRYAEASARPDAGDSAQRHLDEAVRRFDALPVAARKEMVDTLGTLLVGGATEATQRGDTARTRQILVLARRHLAPLDDGAGYVHNAEAVVRYFGMAAPSVHADFVRGADSGAARGPWPRRGRWTLIAPLPNGRAPAGFYRHVHETFGDSVDILFVTATRGTRDGRGPFTPADEATYMYEQMTKHWGIPGVLLVETQPFHRLPDRRRVFDGTITPSLYWGTGLVVDPQGTIRAMMTPGAIARFDPLLTSLMRAPLPGGAARGAP